MSGDHETETAASRSKDCVPSWNGEASTFVAYEEAACLWEQGIVYNRRYTAAPRLMAELTGAARRLVAGKPAEEVAFVGGVRVLLNYLRRTLGKPQVNEVTDLLGKYFKGTRRRSGESMNEYITRKSEAFMRVSQALKRVQPHYKQRRPTGSALRGRRDSDPWSATTWSRQNTGGHDDDGDAVEAEPPDAEADDAGTTTSRTSWWQAAPSDWSWRSSWNGWEGQSQWRWDWNYDSWRYSNASSYGGSPSTWSAPETVEDESLLPSFIQGWYLLADAALDSAERNIIATALNGDYSPARAAQELRNQFPETELRRKDQGRRSHAFVSMDDIYETENYDELADYEEDKVEEEDQAMLAAAEEAQQAMATMERARRTLKDARMRQHSVKMNRQYYRGNYQNRASGAGGSGRPSSSTGASGSSGPNSEANMICLGCGVKGHRVRPNMAMLACPRWTRTTSHCLGLGIVRQGTASAHAKSE